jgi:hypothetical protein
MPDTAGGEAQDAWQPRVAACCAGAIFALASVGADADYRIAANTISTLGAGALNLACTDLIVAGTLHLGSGAILNARHVNVQPGGTVHGESGFIAISGDWTTSATGQFIAGASDVRFDDTCGAGPSLISGNTTFYGVRFIGTTGKSFIFAANSTQTIEQFFEFRGTATAPTQFRSSASGQVSNINLRPNATQTVAHVGVTDVWATGQWLAPYLSNEGGGGNARRWFGTPDDAVAAIPLVSNLTLLVLAALLGLTGALALAAHRRRFRPDARMRRSRVH